MTIVDQFDRRPMSSLTINRSHRTENRAISLDDQILRVIEEDPFSTIGEIKQDLSRQSPGEDVGWWRIFFILKRRGLLTRRSRFDYVRRR